VEFLILCLYSYIIIYKMKFTRRVCYGAVPFINYYLQ